MPAVKKRRFKVTVLLDREEFEGLNAYCEQHSAKKSTLIARLIREHLKQYGVEPFRKESK